METLGTGLPDKGEEESEILCCKWKTVLEGFKRGVWTWAGYGGEWTVSD